MIGRTYRSRRHKSAVLLFGRAYSKAGIGSKNYHSGCNLYTYEQIQQMMQLKWLINFGKQHNNNRRGNNNSSNYNMNSINNINNVNSLNYMNSMNSNMNRLNRMNNNIMNSMSGATVHSPEGRNWESRNSQSR